MKRSWWKEAVVYQIYPKSFCDTSGNGYGDIKGIISKLDYLMELGINAVWLTPFFKSPMIDNGYDISDYQDIDAMFGNMADFELLIKEANDRGIRILIDLVLNHTSAEHPWFQSALSSENSPYRNYYIFKKTENGCPPNNWRSIFGGSAWECVDENTYFLHTFHKEQPDLNWENPSLRQAIYDMIKFWMDKGVQGFRIDAITYIKKPASYTSGPADGEDGLRDISKDTTNQPGIHEFLQEMKEATYKDEGYLTVAEAPGVPNEHIGAYVGEGGDFSMIFDFSYSDLDFQENGRWYPAKEWTIEAYREKLFISQLACQQVGWAALFTESHDQPRSISKFFGIDDGHENDYLKATAIATMYFLMRGTPFVYQGQELGITNHLFKSIDEINDIASIDNYEYAISVGASEEEAIRVVNRRSRDHSRTPMLWTDQCNAGFTKGVPWLPVNDNYLEINAACQQDQNASVFKYYKQLIQLRAVHKKSLVYGTFRPILDNVDDLLAYQRSGDDGQELTVIVNLSDKAMTIDMNLRQYDLLLGNYGASEASAIFHEGKIRPYEALVLEKRR